MDWYNRIDWVIETELRHIYYHYWTYEKRVYFPIAATNTTNGLMRVVVYSCVITHICGDFGWYIIDGFAFSRPSIFNYK